MRISFVSQQPTHVRAVSAMQTCGCADVAGMKPWALAALGSGRCGDLIVEVPH